MPCKRTLSMPGWKTRLCLNIPGFGETNGVRAVRGGNPRGRAMLSRFLYRLRPNHEIKKKLNNLPVLGIIIAQMCYNCKGQVTT
jgi:hypothetical protein